MCVIMIRQLQYVFYNYSYIYCKTDLWFYVICKTFKKLNITRLIKKSSFEILKIKKIKVKCNRNYCIIELKQRSVVPTSL